MSWNWSIFVFTRIYNCLITSSNCPTVSGLWLVSSPHLWPLIGWHQALTTLGRTGSRVTGSRFIITASVCITVTGQSVFRVRVKTLDNSRPIPPKLRAVSSVVGVGSAWGRDDVGDVDVMMRWGEMTWLLLMDHDQSGMISSCDILTSYNPTCW